jgi:DNA-binding response OmpR family regulator
LRKLRISEKTRKTHIVVLTGMTNEMIKQSVLTEGVDAYLLKPYDSQVLLETIDKILNKTEDAGHGTGDKQSTEAPEEPTLFEFAAGRHQLGK